MSDATNALRPGALRAPRATLALPSAWSHPGSRRALQLALATIWLLDGVLQLQGSFLSRSFGDSMIAGMAQGNPGVVAAPITESASLIAAHPVLVDSLFALIQVAIGLAIAWRPTVRVGLGASIAWAIGVWWVGEGLGGVLNGTANAVNGAPGAVTIYALLAVLLWPAERRDRAPFVAARATGTAVACALWALLWGSMAYFAVAGSNRADPTLHRLLAAEATGEPAWLASLDRSAAAAVDHHGTLAAFVLAFVLAGVAVGVYLPRRPANATVVVAGLLGAVIWVVGENFGGLFTSAATDVNSGPLLVLLAAAFWRSPPALAAPPGEATTSPWRAGRGA